MVMLYSQFLDTLKQLFKIAVTFLSEVLDVLSVEIMWEAVALLTLKIAIGRGITFQQVYIAKLRIIN